MQGGGLPQAAKHSLAVAFSEINFKNSPGDFLQKVPLAAVYDAFLFSPFGENIQSIRLLITFLQIVEKLLTIT